MKSQFDSEDFVDLRKTDSSERTIPVLASGNMGNTTLKSQWSIKDLARHGRVYNRKTIDDLDLVGTELDAQRPLFEKHAKGLAQYVVVGLVSMLIRQMEREGEEVSPRIKALQKQLNISNYSNLAPIVANIRNCRSDLKDLNARRIWEALDNGTRQQLDGVYRITLSSRHVLSIVDGQHRVVGFGMVMKWLKSITSFRQYPKAGLFQPKDELHDGSKLHPEIVEFWERIEDIATSQSTVAVEIHLGATAEQERQIFADLNSKGKPVPLSVSLEYDESDAVNRYLNQAIREAELFRFPTPITDSSDWHADAGGLLRKHLNPISTLLIAGKGSSKGITPAQVNTRSGPLDHFWKAIQNIEHFGQPGAKSKTVAAQAVVLKGLAKLVFDLQFGPQNSRNEEHVAQLWEAIKSGQLNFSHTEPMWRSLMLNSDDRENLLPGVSRYVHVPTGTNLDAGTFEKETGWVRYGSKHNDIYPRIGDLIRWKLGFEPRPSVSRSIAKDDQAKVL